MTGPSRAHQHARARAESIITCLLHDDEHTAVALVRQDPHPYQLAWAALRMLAHTFAAITSSKGMDPSDEWRKHLLAVAHKRD